MRILLDPGTPELLRRWLIHHEVSSAAEEGWIDVSSLDLIQLAQQRRTEVRCDRARATSPFASRQPLPRGVCDALSRQRLVLHLFLPVGGVVIRGDGQQPYELAIAVRCGAT